LSTKKDREFIELLELLGFIRFRSLGSLISLRSFGAFSGPVEFNREFSINLKHLLTEAKLLSSLASQNPCLFLNNRYNTIWYNTKR